MAARCRLEGLGMCSHPTLAPCRRRNSCTRQFQRSSLAPTFRALALGHVFQALLRHPWAKQTATKAATAAIKFLHPETTPKQFHHSPPHFGLKPCATALRHCFGPHMRSGDFHNTAPSSRTQQISQLRPVDCPGCSLSPSVGGAVGVSIGGGSDFGG